MNYLERVSFSGEAGDIKLIQQKFGMVYVGNPIDKVPIHFRIKRFRNRWISNAADPPPLFVLIPNIVIQNVWPEWIHRVGKVKYGTSSAGVSGVLVQHPDGEGIYICLSPEGYKLEDSDSFGI